MLPKNSKRCCDFVCSDPFRLTHLSYLSKAVATGWPKTDEMWLFLHLHSGNVHTSLATFKGASFQFLTVLSLIVNIHRHEGIILEN